MCHTSLRIICFDPSAVPVGRVGLGGLASLASLGSESSDNARRSDTGRYPGGASGPARWWPERPGAAQGETTVRPSIFNYRRIRDRVGYSAWFGLLRLRLAIPSHGCFRPFFHHHHVTPPPHSHQPSGSGFELGPWGQFNLNPYSIPTAVNRPVPSALFFHTFYWPCSGSAGERLRAALRLSRGMTPCLRARQTTCRTCQSRISTPQ